MRLPTRETLAEWSPELLHAAKSAAQCDVYLLARDGRRLILKDGKGRRGTFRLLRRWILRREQRALQRLDGLEGVPRCYGWLDRDALLLEYLDARRLKRAGDQELPGPEALRRLETLVADIHRRGVVHGDLRRGNILIDDRQRLYLIDFATAWDDGSLLGRFMLRRLKAIDQLKVLALRRELQPASLSAAELQRLERPPLTLKLAHFFKKNVYRHLKQKRWRGSIRSQKSGVRSQESED